MAGADGAVVAGVLQGYGPTVGWADLAEAAYAVQAGAVWVATNVDATLPTARGLAPGNGTLVEAVRQATGVEPLVVGKPHTPLYDLSAQVLGVGPEQTLAIGDRLDTDIAGANAAGMPSLLVLTGVHGVREAARATAAERPRYLATDLRAVGRPVRRGGAVRRWVVVWGSPGRGGRRRHSAPRRRGIARRAAALRGRSAVGRGRHGHRCPALTTRRGTGSRCRGRARCDGPAGTVALAPTAALWRIHGF